MPKPFRIGFLLLALVVAAGVLFPQARTWGVHFLAYYPTGIRILIAVAAAVLAILSLFPSAAAKFAEKFRATHTRPLLTDVIAALLCGAGFYMFASAVPLLGDGQLWINELANPERVAWVRRGPLTVIALGGVNQFFHGLFGTGEAETFRLTSSLAGVIAVFAWLHYARGIGFGLATALLWGFAWGGVVLFFGYVELYIIMAGMLCLTLAFMLNSVRQNRFSLWVPVMAIIATGFNFIAWTFWPAVGAYIWWGITRKPLKPKTVFLAIAALFFVAGIVYFILGWQHGTEILLPLWPSATSAGGYAFAPRHFVDLANGLLLSAGPLLVLLAAFLWTRHAQPFWNTERLLLALALIVPFAAYFMHNSGLGMARDWDIGATLLLAVPFAALSLWKDGFSEIKERASGSLLVAAWIIAVIVPWIGVQASETRAMTRYADLLRLDPERSANGWDYLGAFYALRNQTEEWARCYEEALKHSDNPRYHYNLALYNISQRQWDQALMHVNAARNAVYADSAITGWEVRVMDPQSMLNVGLKYEKVSRFDDARQVYWLASQLDPNSPLPPTAMAEMIVRLHDLARAEGMFHLLFSTFPQQASEVKRYYVTLTQERTADKQIEGLAGLAVLARIEGDFFGARDNLKRALKLAPEETQFNAYLSALEP
jgi:tetratricopeptide (TPR) repeat protein